MFEQENKVFKVGIKTALDIEDVVPKPSKYFLEYLHKIEEAKKAEIAAAEALKKEIEEELAAALVAEIQETVADQFSTNVPVIEEVANEKKVEMKGKWMKVSKSSSLSRNTSAGISGRGKI